jgi:signal transduction histidine kinase
MAGDKQITIQPQIQYRLIEELTQANNRLQAELEAHKKLEISLIEDKDKAQQAAKSKARFLANMSHEIRTPMNGIIGLTHLLLKTNINEKQQEYLKAIVTSSDTLTVIINDILDIAKMESGKVTIDNKEYNLRNTISSVLELFASRAMDKNLMLTSDIDEIVPELVIGDAARLSQILFNLIGNGIKFTKKGEVNLTIRVLSRQKSKVELKFIVSDTGIGIGNSKLKYIFKAFAQARSNTSRKYGGTGLGLTIVKRLIE